MKHFILTILVVAVAGTATAQIEKGGWLLGANSSIGFNSYSAASGTDATMLDIGSKAGYFVAENFVLGINLNYLSISQGSTSSYTTIGFFTRYYIKKIFVGAGYNSISTSPGSVSFGSIPIELGVAAFVTRNIAFEPAIVYTLSTDPDQGGIPGYGAIPFPAKSSIGIKLGFTLYLGRPAE